MADEEVDALFKRLLECSLVLGVAHPEIGEVVERTSEDCGAVPSVRLRVEDVGVPERVNRARKTEHAIRVPNVEGEEANVEVFDRVAHFERGPCAVAYELGLQPREVEALGSSQRGGEWLVGTDERLNVLERESGCFGGHQVAACRMSLASVMILPSKFCPRQLRGSSTPASVMAIPIPQMVSSGLASTNGSVVLSSMRRRSSFCRYFSSVPRSTMAERTFVQRASS